MRSKVDLPAPFAPNNANASPGRASRDIPPRATTEGFSKGCKRARQPLRAGGKDFSRSSIRMAASGTKELIACLDGEDNETPNEQAATSRKVLTCFLIKGPE